MARQDSRSCYFTFVNAGTEEGSHHFVPVRRGGTAAGTRSLTDGQFYFSIAEAQFKVIDKGAALASSIFVAIRNLFPSPLTS